MLYSCLFRKPTNTNGSMLVNGILPSTLRRRQSQVSSSDEGMFICLVLIMSSNVYDVVSTLSSVYTVDIYCPLQMRM